MLRRSLVLVVAAVVVFAACRPIPRAPGLPLAPSGTTAVPFLIDDDCDGATRVTIDSPDPYVYRWLDGAYYAFTTAHDFNNVPVYKSTDLATWNPAGTPCGLAMPNQAPWTAFGCHWAPSVTDTGNSNVNQRFVMYYTARVKGQGTCPGPGLQCIGIAYSAHVDGPYVDPYPGPRLCQEERGGTIDASPFNDLAGKRYLIYKSEDSNLWSSEVTHNGSVIGSPHLLLSMANGPTADHPRVEGPTMIRTAAGLFLFYSAGDWMNGSYHVSVARCDSPFGPCRRVYSTPVLKSRYSMLGPGGQTPFTDATGQLRMAFHAWQAPKVGYTPDPSTSGQRSLRILKLFFDGPNGNPRISN